MSKYATITLKFYGGPPVINGAVVEAASYRVDSLLAAHARSQLSVGGTGLLYDRARGQYVSGAKVVRRPDAIDAGDGNGVSNRVALHTDVEIPEHRPSRDRPPRATVPTATTAAPAKKPKKAKKEKAAG